MRNDDNLQPEIVNNHGKELQLVLDNKTRWNSLLRMLRRFVRVEREIKVALINMNMVFPFNEEEMEMIRELCESLNHLEVAVNYLCKENMDMVKADQTISFTLSELGNLNTAISFDLMQSLGKRVRERRNAPLIHAMNYLAKPDFINNEIDEFGEAINKTEIRSVLTSLLERLYQQEVSLNDEDLDFNSPDDSVNLSNISTNSSCIESITNKLESYYAICLEQIILTMHQPIIKTVFKKK